MFDVLTKIIYTDMKNGDIANLFFLDKSIISKVRNKRIWNKVWKLFYKEKMNSNREIKFKNDIDDVNFTEFDF